MTELPLPALKRVHIQRCPEVGSYGLSRILQCAPDVEDLWIEHCNDIYLIELMISYPCPQLTQLRRFRIDWEPGSDFWPHLTTFISASPLEHFSIDIGRQRQSMPFDTPFLRGFLQSHGARLRSFTAVGFEFDDAMMDQICSSCPQLVELELCWYSPDYHPVPKADIFAKCRHLRSFKLGMAEYVVARGPSHPKGISLVERKTSVLN
ncbi:hypothetical protein BOTBODRAFT_52302 [Botryobasidium botryosum FD-172 SS1]|uniref:F-box domain-containing protein n=1 Tax=Botryobasidium botryosum (strain FD-172 SS1) TaxID=930990 RepID=A0A067N5S0_BOTB1|nr:hypothetical protein BOTBODRAFT_52302 [Botryobasidium botryosum FD-172 SS1]